MVSRATHYRAKAKHDQRGFGESKPALPPRDTTTAWVGPFVSSIQGLTEPFSADSIIALSLGATTEERTVKLRELSKLGVLRMYALWENKEFVGYRWKLTEEGTL